MSKAKEINEKILDRCASQVMDDDTTSYYYFKQALNSPANYLRIVIQSISEVIAEEVEKLEKEIAKKKTRELKKR